VEVKSGIALFAHSMRMQNVIHTAGNLMFLSSTTLRILQKICLFLVTRSTLLKSYTLTQGRRNKGSYRPQLLGHWSS